MRLYVNVTKCPVALWLNFNNACEEEYRQEKVMKCPPNYTPQEDKSSDLWIKLDTNANPNVANLGFSTTPLFLV